MIFILYFEVNVTKNIIMKKRHKKNLRLNKKAVSSLVVLHKIKGGETNTGCGFTSNRLNDCCDTLNEN
jgi:hypothetical protein